MRTVPGSEIVRSAELRRREHKKKKERKKEVKNAVRKLERGRAAEPVIFANFSHALHFRGSFPPLSLSLKFSLPAVCRLFSRGVIFTPYYPLGKMGDYS